MMKVSEKEREICRAKKVYPSKNKARYWAGLQHRTHPEWNKLRAYKCAVCGKYHLTSEPADFMKRRRWYRINSLWDTRRKNG